MNVYKALGILGVLLAIVGVFVQIPQLAAILVVLGLIGGWVIAAEDHVRVIVSALALGSLGAALEHIPTVGHYLAQFVANLAVMVAGAALIIILCNVYRRFKP